MKLYDNLTVIEKIWIKQQAMNEFGKRWCMNNAGQLRGLNELQIIFLV